MGQVVRVVRHPVAQNAIALGWVQIATLALPLVTLPIVARALGPKGLGLLIFAQSYTGIVYLLGEYGFGLSAGRDIARVRADRHAVAGVVAGVQSAKVLLFALTLALSTMALLVVPQFRDAPEYLLLATVDALALGLSPLWYFRGIERLRLMAGLILASRVAAAAGVVFLVRDHGDGWIVLALTAASDLVAGVVGLFILYRDVPALRLRRAEALRSLRSGWFLFVYNASMTLYTSANGFVLGLYAAPTQVAYFGGGERLTRAATRMVGPVSEAMFPRVSNLVATGAYDRAHKIAGRTLVGLTLGGCAAAGVTIGFAPLVVSLLLGPGYEGAVPVLRILSSLIPLVAITNVLGIQWMIPLGLDRPFSFVILAAGPVNVLLLAVLAARYGAVGAAWALPVTEVLVTAGFVVVLARRGLLPIFQRSPPPAAA